MLLTLLFHAIAKTNELYIRLAYNVRLQDVVSTKRFLAIANARRRFHSVVALLQDLSRCHTCQSRGVEGVYTLGRSDKRNRAAP